ncbi:MAG: sialate O-acetylesterase [Pseudomonadota bacterium]
MLINLGVGLSAQNTGSGGVPTHVIGLAGQSNMQGGPSFDGGASWPAGTFQWGRNGANNGVIIPAAGNLQHQGGYGAGKMSLAVQFAIDYLAANPGVQLLFMPGAKGGTSFAGNDWNKGDSAYEDFVSRLNAIFAQNPSFSLKGILWQHGETDADTGGGSSYGASLDQMIIDLRSDIIRANEMTPFTIGDIPADVADNGASHAAVSAAIADVENRVPYTAMVASTGLSTYDGVHFDAASLRTLGGRHAVALGSAHLNDGSEINILDNGGFDNASRWTLSGAVAIAGGVGTVSSGTGYWRQTGVPLVAGKTYRITWTVSNYTSGTTTPFFLGGSSANGTYIVGPGTHSQTLTAKSGNTVFQLNCGGGSTLDVDDISIVEV